MHVLEVEAEDGRAPTASDLAGYFVLWIALLDDLHLASSVSSVYPWLIAPSVGNLFFVGEVNFQRNPADKHLSTVGAAEKPVLIRTIRATNVSVGAVVATVVHEESRESTGVP